MVLVLVMMATLLGGSVCFGTTYYVATDGDNSKSGLNEPNAFATIQYGVYKAGNYDTIMIGAGTYDANTVDLSGKIGVTLQGNGATRDDVTISWVPTEEYDHTVRLGKECELHHLTIENDVDDGHNWSAAVYIGPGADDTVIDNCHIVQIDTYGEGYSVFVGLRSKDGDNRKIANNSRIINSDLESKSFCLEYRQSNLDAGTTYHYIKDCTITADEYSAGSNSEPFWVNGPIDVTVTSCTITAYNEHPTAYNALAVQCNNGAQTDLVDCDIHADGGAHVEGAALGVYQNGASSVTRIAGTTINTEGLSYCWAVYVQGGIVYYDSTSTLEGDVKEDVEGDVVQAPTYYVATDGDDDANGLSWSTAFATIQKGINEAETADTVLVGPGDYAVSSPIDFEGKVITVSSSDDKEAACVYNESGFAFEFEDDEGFLSTLRNFVIAGGRSGVKIGDGCSPTIRNLTIVSNDPNNDNGGVGLEAAVGSAGGVDSCIIWDNGTNVSGDPNTIMYSCVEDGDDDAGQGNISDDPLFVDADDSNDPDYHLDPNSPCIDTGDPARGVGSEPCPDGNRINMGAYGGASHARESKTLSCVKCDSPFYDDWVYWGRPDCWCYRKNCNGDADGLLNGPFRVANPDLLLLLSAINKIDTQIPAGGICADFDHIKNGPFRVANPDLQLLNEYINDLDYLVPECSMDWDGDGDDDYNFWTN